MKVVLMHMYKDIENGRKNAEWYFRETAKRENVTVGQIKNLIDCQFHGNIPQIYCQDYCEQIDVDRWSDKIAVFTPDGEIANRDNFHKGDILEMLDMPFDNFGRHATGYAIWREAYDGVFTWMPEYYEK